MSGHYLKSFHASLVYLLSFSSLIAVSPELGFAMDQKKIDENEKENTKNAIPKIVKIENQNLDLDWGTFAEDHKKTAVRYEQMLQDMRVEDIPSAKEDALTYAQRILKHRELSTLCEEVEERNKKGLDISDKKNEVEQKLTELYGPLKIEFKPLGILQKIIALRKISNDLTLVLGKGNDLFDKAIIINSDSETNPDIIANFFAPSFVPTILQLFKGKKFEKIIVENHSPKFFLDGIFLETLKKLSSKDTKLIFNDCCYFTILGKEYFNNQELCMYERHGPFHAVAMTDEEEEEKNEETQIEQLSLDLSSSKPSEENSVFRAIDKEHIIITLINRYKLMRDLFEPYGFYINPFYFPLINEKELDYASDSLLPKSPYPKENASPYLWTGVFNPTQKLIEIENNNIFNLVPLEQLIPTLLTPFQKVESTPVESKKTKLRKKKVNKKITTIKIEKTDLNTKSVDKLLQFIEGDDKKKGNNNRSQKIRKKKKGKNTNIQKKEEKKNENK